ncbi:MAG: malto-oligosyltrehalose synthase [Nitrospirae bacterium]|nr:malto-oligosyltrehalose synthase [Nitrospirota bacterium]
MGSEKSLAPRIPISTYRLQFNHEFRFADAREIIPYLHDLGITDIYASPYFKAQKGSLHGYDIVDHNSLNPEIGTREEYDALTEELRRYGMGQILDIVPNHMYIAGKDNIWWMDVLENGPASPYADFFDIDWEPAKREIRGKLLLPILGDQYGKVLENRELILNFEEGAFFVDHYEHRFPVRPQTFTRILEHRIDELRERLSEENPDVIELLSILTAVRHLPRYGKTDREKREERYREKEVIKKRLRVLYEECPEIRAFIDENVRIFNGVEGQPRSFDLLDGLLDEQVYRLSHWRVAAEEINYRRFFDINSLAALRIENPNAFRETHRLVMELIREGKVTGLRIDHPDGLYNPSGYFRQLQQSCFVQLRTGHVERLNEEIGNAHEVRLSEEELLEQYDGIVSADPDYKPFYIVGEKILTKGEKMPEEWPIFSTTGYVFLNSLNGIFVETKNAKSFNDMYTRFVGTKTDFQSIVYEKKKLVMEVAMSGEVNTLGHYLNRISEKNRHTRDFTLNSLIRAIAEVIAYFPVYRTYVAAYTVKDRDRQYIELAIAKAKRANPSMSASVFDFLRDVLLLRFPGYLDEREREEWLAFVMRFQQITGPVMAKGVEDTVFYVYNRLISMNEVGGMPERFGTPSDTFHGQNIERSKSWPHALITTSTHDMKRSEDVRARINVLSEMPGEWKTRLLQWSRLNRKKKAVIDGRRVPDRNEEYLLYQTLIGAWPVTEIERAGYEQFEGRIEEYMRKAVRETKVNSSWINPDVAYEDALMGFVDAILDNSSDNQFLRDFTIFQKAVSHFGMFNSLSQVLLKIASPGVPDFYQGTELWNFSLVDPDNRRSVDYGGARKMLEELKREETRLGPVDLTRKLIALREDGRIKLYVTWKALNYRKDNREVFDLGEYVPLEVIGEKSANVCAFLRRLRDKRVVVVVPRFLASLVPSAEIPPCGAVVWGDSFVAVPQADAGVKYRNIFTEETVPVMKRGGGYALFPSEALANVPVALLENTDGM